MEIKREIVESKSEVSKDNLWLKPEDNKKKLLYYGIKGWTELSGSGTCEPSNPDDKIDFNKLSADELLELSKELEKAKKKLPPEEYVRILVSGYDNLYDIRKNLENINGYILNNLSDKWSYDYDGEKYDSPEIVKVLDKGARLQANQANPDLYIEVINDNGLNYILLQFIIQLNTLENLFEYLYSEKNIYSEYYELQNGKVVKIENVQLSDYIKIVDKSIENGSNEVTDGFRPRIKGDTLILDSNLDAILEYYKCRSFNNIIQDYGKYIIVSEKIDHEYKNNKYKVVSTAGFTLKDYYIIFNDGNNQNEDTKIHKENILEFIGEYNIKSLSEYRKVEYLQDGDKITWNIKRGDKFYLVSQPHIEFTVLADDIERGDLEKIYNLGTNVAYNNSVGSGQYIYVGKYYPPYEDYKNPQYAELYRYYNYEIMQIQKHKEEAERSKTELVSLLDKLKDKIQYSGEIITTIVTY